MNDYLKLSSNHNNNSKYKNSKDDTYDHMYICYAGHYAPQLAALILEHNKRQNIKPINLKAIAVLISHSMFIKELFPLFPAWHDFSYTIFLAWKSTTRHRNKRRSRRILVVTWSNIRRDIIPREDSVQQLKISTRIHTFWMVTRMQWCIQQSFGGNGRC